MAKHCFAVIDLISYYNIYNMYTHTSYPHLPSSHSIPPFKFLTVFVNYFIATQQSMQLINTCTYVVEVIFSLWMDFPPFNRPPSVGDSTHGSASTYESFQNSWR